MNSFDSESSSNSNSNDSDPWMIFPSSQDTFYETYKQQIFPFRNSLIRYITMNPSTPECYQKMIQTCKHFFIKNPILILKRFNIFLFDNGSSTIFNDKHVDLNSIPNKLWVTDEITVNDQTENGNYFASKVIPKIYRLDFRTLKLTNLHISIKNFIFLASKCLSVALICVTVKNANGTILGLEIILGALPQVREFEVYLDYNVPNLSTSKMVQKLLKIPHFSKLSSFCLINIPESFDIDAFYVYLQVNKTTAIDLNFRDDISEEYKSRLQAIIDEIVNTENHEYKVPWIHFTGIDDSSVNKLRELISQQK